MIRAGYQRDEIADMAPEEVHLRVAVLERMMSEEKQALDKAVGPKDSKVMRFG